MGFHTASNLALCSVPSFRHASLCTDRCASATGRASVVFDLVVKFEGDKFEQWIVLSI